MEPSSNDKQTSRLLRFIEAECKAIQFYAENLHGLNYAQNKKRIDMLLLDSTQHLEILSKLLLQTSSYEPRTISQELLDEAQREEEGMKEIYAYAIRDCTDEQTKKKLQQLVKWEEKHKKLVEELQ